MTDTTLAILFALIILYLTYRFFLDTASWPLTTKTSSSVPAPFSLETAYTAYLTYPILAHQTLAQMRSSYASTSVSLRHKRIGYALGYPDKLKRLEEVIRENEEVTRRIVQCAERKHPEITGGRKDTRNPAHLTRVIETLKHLVRDWSDSGAFERRIIHTPIIQALTHLYPSRDEIKILIPGAGLARLAWDISRLGFTVTANEISGYMLLALDFLLSDSDTRLQVDECKVHPYAHWFSHQRTRDGVFRGLRFPDVLPRVDEKFSILPGDFLLLGSSGTGAEEYDVIVTLFFIDTSTNVLATLDQIYALLGPGGTWINLGPLLWPGGGQARLELSLEEVLKAAKEVGFQIVGDPDPRLDSDTSACLCNSKNCDGSALKMRTVECEYTKDEQAMMRWVYQAEFWVARKI